MASPPFDTVVREDATELRFSASDREREDARESAAFRDALHGPAADEESPGLTDHGGGRTTSGTIYLGVFFFACFALVAATGRLSAFLIFPFLLAVRALYGRSHALRRRPASPPAEVSWTIRFDAAQLTVLRGEEPCRSIPLGSLTAFEGGRRVHALLGDGSRVEMPFAMRRSATVEPIAAHAELVTALDAHLARWRAARVGYRGDAPPELAPSPECEAAEDREVDYADADLPPGKRQRSR